MLVSKCNPNFEFGQCTDSPAIIRLKQLVLNATDKRIKVSQLFKLACCFDPAVCKAVLSSSECSQLLQDAYQNLIKENSAVRHVFAGAKTSNVKHSNDIIIIINEFV